MPIPHTCIDKLVDITVKYMASHLPHDHNESIAQLLKTLHLEKHSFDQATLDKCKAYLEEATIIEYSFWRPLCGQEVSIMEKFSRAFLLASQELMAVAAVAKAAYKIINAVYSYFHKHKVPENLVKHLDQLLCLIMDADKTPTSYALAISHKFNELLLDVKPSGSGGYYNDLQQLHRDLFAAFYEQFPSIKASLGSNGQSRAVKANTHPVPQPNEYGHASTQFSSQAAHFTHTQRPPPFNPSASTTKYMELKEFDSPYRSNKK